MAQRQVVCIMLLASVPPLQRGACEPTTICVTEDCPPAMMRRQHWCGSFCRRCARRRLTSLILSLNHVGASRCSVSTLTVHNGSIGTPLIIACERRQACVTRTSACSPAMCN